MIRIIKILTLLLVVTNIYGQSIFKPKTKSRLTDFYYDKNSCLVCSTIDNSVPLQYDSSENFIFKLNKKGEYSKSVSSKNTVSFVLEDGKIIQNNGLIYSFNTYQTSNDYGIWIKIYNDSLQFLYAIDRPMGKIQNPNDSFVYSLYLRKLIIVPNGNFCLNLSIYKTLKTDISESRLVSTEILLIDSNLKIIKSHKEFVNDFNNPETNDFSDVLINNQNQIIAVQNQLFNFTSKIYVFDYDLNLLKSFKYEYPNTSDYYFKYPSGLNNKLDTLNDSYYLTGAISSPLSPIIGKSISNILHVFKLDKDSFQVQKRYSFSDNTIISECNKVGTRFTGLVIFPILKTSGQSIYTVNAYYAKVSSSFPEKMKSWISVNKLDTDLNLVWCKTIQMDSFVYYNHLVVDGNKIYVAGTIYDSLNGYGRTPFIFEFDTLGNFTSSIMPVLNKKLISNLLVYPNPSPDNIFNFEITDDKISEITIYNTTGKEVYHTLPSKPIENYSINLDCCESGIYLYKINTQNTQNITGKLLKQ